MSTYTKRLQPILIIAGLVLLIPFIAMQFTDEVNWGVMDFVIAGALLLISGFLIDLIFRKTKNRNYRIIFCLAVVLLLLLVWAELAVGIL